MGELRSSLDALAAEDLKPMFAPQLLDRLAPLLVAQNRIAAEVARTVRECELTGVAEHDGLKTMQSWLRGHAHLAEAEAARVVAAGRALEQLPETAAAFADGAITAGQVAVIARVAEPERIAAAEQRNIDVAEIDRTLAATAASAPHATVKQAVGHYLACLDPDGPEPDPTEGRCLTMTRHADGSGSGRFDLDAVGFEKVQAALESFVQADRPKGDSRTRAQQQADALVQLADNALASGNLPILRTVKPQVIVTIPLEDLADATTTGPGTARTGFGAAISAAWARWVACDAGITRVVLDPDGVPLDFGRTKRLVTGGLRQAVEVRDRHCVFAGCGAPTHWCDVHHLIEWINGGETSLENSALLCERHHTKVHNGFCVERQPDGRWRTYRPDGSQILIGPTL
jgi:hypothetical protein